MNWRCFAHAHHDSLEMMARVRMDSIQLASQFPCGRKVDLEPAPLGANHHAVVAPRRCHRYVSRTDIGEHPLGIPFHRRPKSTPAPHLDQKTVAGIERNMTRRQSLHRSVLAHDTETIGHRIFSTVKSPRRAMRPLHGRLDTCRRNDANFLLHTEAAAEL